MLLESSVDSIEGLGEGTRIAPRVTFNASSDLLPSLDETSAGSAVLCERAVRLG
jgi:hypothetical protein